MLNLTHILCLVVLALVGTVLLTPIVVLLLRKYGFWNQLDEMHKDPVPRGGGIGIALVFFILLLCDSFFREGRVTMELLKPAPSFLILLVTGLVDDSYGLKAKPKFLLQTLAMTILWLSGVRINSLLGWQLPVILSFIVTWIWGIGILNAFNLIDGLDGLCSGNAMIAAFALGWMAVMTGSIFTQVMAVIVIGCCIGFLFYNFHPAQLFLGDTGSLLLGYLSVVMSLKVTNETFDLHTFAALLMIFWIPFCDEGLAIWRRKVKSMLRPNSASVMERDMHHLHYRLLDMVNHHSRTVLIIWGGMIIIDAFAMTLFRFQLVWLTFTLLGILALFSLAVFAQHELRYSYVLFKYSPLRRFFQKIIQK